MSIKDETNRIEYKEELTDDLEQKTIAFLNYREGGIIYVGVNKAGVTVGLEDIDDVQLRVAGRLRDNILPSVLGLFDLIAEERDGLPVLKIVIPSGIEKPYYLKKYGMSPKGCFIRVGSSAEPMTTKMIDEMYSRRNRIRLDIIESPRQQLTFNQLKIYYEESGLMLTDQFKTNLDLYTPDGKYNYNAYLLADENGVSIKVAKYAGTDKVDLIENEEYGYCCLIKATNQVLDKLAVENKTFTKITSKTRLEKKMIDAIPLREAVINFIVHNDYSREVPPVVELFSNRLTVTSYGGLVDGLSKEDFFDCISMPRNRTLMRVFKDVGLVEHLGSGMSRILKAYNKSIFDFKTNFMVVTFPYAEGYLDVADDKDVTDDINDGVSGGVSGGVKKPLKNSEIRVLEAIKNDTNVSINDIASVTGLSSRTVDRAVSGLKQQGIIVSNKSKRNGQWEVINQD